MGDNLFAVIRSYGPPYDPGRSLEAQPEWEAHRVFMNDLEAKGVARLAGPLEGGGDVPAHIPFQQQTGGGATIGGRSVDQIRDPLNHEDRALEPSSWPCRLITRWNRAASPEFSN